MVVFRTELFCGACLASILSTSAVRAAEQHGKTVKQCNDELKADAAALEAAGESASTFFHACWWRTAAGQKTPIETASKTAKSDGKATKAAAVGSAESEPSREAEPAVRPARHVTRSHERAYAHRFLAVRHVPRRDEETDREPVETPVAVDAAVPPSAPPRAAQGRPLIDTIPVAVGGVPNAVMLSVPAGLTPWVKDVLNHPAVPGLTAAP